MSPLLRILSTLALIICASIQSASAINITIASADADRWNYAFNSSPGTRQSAPTFSAVGEGAFDNMDGQFLVGFDTDAAGLPALAADEVYRINSVEVAVTHSAGTFSYDPTFDPYQSYLPGADPEFIADADTGRPVEIYGADLRGGYAGFAFDGGVTGPPNYNEGSFYAFADPTLAKVRNAYAFDAGIGDVSNVIDDRLFDAMPWAVGQAAGLSPGASVPEGVVDTSPGQTFTFDVDLARSDVENHLHDGLEAGGLFFSVVSLHTTTMGGSSNPNYYTADSLDSAAIPPSLQLDVDVFIKGDFNYDGVVNGLDANILSENFLDSAGYTLGDANRDGTVDGLDANIVSENFLKTSSATAIPEPSSFALAAILFALGFGFRTRSRK